MGADDDDHPDTQKFLKLLESFRFSDRYYAYCAAHAAEGPDLPTAAQTTALAETGRTFRHNKKEKFFAWRDANAPADCELGLNVSLEHGQVEWILVFKTPSGHLGRPFPALALQTKRLSTPAYRHTPPTPVPNVADPSSLGDALDQGLALYDELAGALAAQTWR